MRSMARAKAPSSFRFIDQSQITPDSAGKGDTRPSVPLIEGNGTLRRTVAMRVAGVVPARR